MHSKKQELEQWYEKKDPWDYLTNADDARRKRIILSELNLKYLRALDIGCGEGFITKDLPALEIYGYELSDTARSRLPKNVHPIATPEEITGTFDLIIATGVFYKQYDWRGMQDIIEKHASGVVLTSNIKEWEINELPNELQYRAFTYPYREFTQQLRLYDFAIPAAQHRNRKSSQLQL